MRCVLEATKDNVTSIFGVVINQELMDGWMICIFTSFSSVFQSYLDNERLIMKDCVQ